MLGVAFSLETCQFLHLGVGVGHGIAVVHGAHHLRVIHIVTESSAFLGSDFQLLLDLLDSHALVDAEADDIADDAASVMIANAALYIPFDELVDIAAETARLSKEKDRLSGEIRRCEGMLKNEKFISKAPQSKIDEEKEKLEKYTQLFKQVEERLAMLTDK